MTPNRVSARYKEKLDDEEKIRLGYFLVMHPRMREDHWPQYKTGTWMRRRGGPNEFRRM